LLKESENYVSLQQQQGIKPPDGPVRLGRTAVKITVTKNVVASPSIHQETSFEDLVQDVDQQVCGKAIQIPLGG
jgi:hypothetical protein